MQKLLVAGSFPSQHRISNVESLCSIKHPDILRLCQEVGLAGFESCSLKDLLKSSLRLSSSQSRSHSPAFLGSSCCSVQSARTQNSLGRCAIKQRSRSAYLILTFIIELLKLIIFHCKLALLRLLCHLIPRHTVSRQVEFNFPKTFPSLRAVLPLFSLSDLSGCKKSGRYA